MTTRASFSPVAFWAWASRSLYLLQVLELERIHRLQIRCQLLARLRIQENIQPAPRLDTIVVVALGADLQVPLQLSPIEDSITARTFGPEPLRHRALVATSVRIRLGINLSNQLTMFAPSRSR